MPGGGVDPIAGISKTKYDRRPFSTFVLRSASPAEESRTAPQMGAWKDDKLMKMKPKGSEPRGRTGGEISGSYQKILAQSQAPSQLLDGVTVSFGQF